MKDIVSPKIARTQASVTEYLSEIMEPLRKLKDELHNIVSGRSVLDDYPFDASRVFRFLGVLLLRLIETASGDDPSAVLATDEVQPQSSSLLKKNSKTPPKRSTKRFREFMVWTPFKVSKASLHNMLAFDLESSCRSFESLLNNLCI